MSSREHTEDVIDTDCMGNLVKNLWGLKSIYHDYRKSGIYHMTTEKGIIISNSTKSIIITINI